MYEYRMKSIEKIIDGDTVDVVIDLGFNILSKQRVRIAGIDTPEKRTRDLEEKEWGLKATAYAEEWFAAHADNLVIRTAIDGAFGKYGRLLGYFYSGDLCYNEMIVDAGLAWTYDGGTKEKDLSELGT